MARGGCVPSPRRYPLWDAPEWTAARSPPVTTDDELLRALPHLELAWNAPLSAARADRLIASLAASPGSRWVDLGCGWGGLLLRALVAYPDATGLGVDRHRMYLDRAERTARDLGVDDRARFVESDIVRFAEPADRVLCIGADHAWGGASTALAHLGRSLAAGGRLLFGCGYWNAPASPEIVAMFGSLPSSLAAVRGLAGSAGWRVRATEVANLTEWDDFEATWRQDLKEVGAREAGTPLGRQALRLLAQRQEEYERGYRGVLGFAYFVLERSSTDPALSHRIAAARGNRASAPTDPSSGTSWGGGKW